MNTQNKISYKTLTQYTIAKNCTDLTDINYALDELNTFVKINYQYDCKLAYKRIIALEKKKFKLLKK